MLSDLKKLETIFEQMSDDGFDVNGPLKWGFFFFDSDKDKLINVFEELRDHGYTQEALDETEDNGWRLFVTKVDILSAEKLHKRNIAFNELAAHCDVALYDGWDVENV